MTEDARHRYIAEPSGIAEFWHVRREDGIVYAGAPEDEARRYADALNATEDTRPPEDRLREALDVAATYVLAYPWPAGTGMEAHRQEVIAAMDALAASRPAPTEPPNCPWCSRPAPHVQSEHYGPATLIGPDPMPSPALRDPAPLPSSLDAAPDPERIVAYIRARVSDEPTLAWPGEIDDILDDAMLLVRDTRWPLDAAPIDVETLAEAMDSFYGKQPGTMRPSAVAFFEEAARLRESQHGG